jgi:hypothetical protein
MSKNLKIFVGFLIIVVIALVGSLAYMLGNRNYNSTQNVIVQQTPIPTASQTNNPSPTVTPSVTPTPAQTKTIEAGGILVFSKYSLKLPSDWTSQNDSAQGSDILTLTKGNYKITISQAAGGGGGCIYPGQTPQEMTQSFISFIEITNPNGYIFRRGQSIGSNGTWTVCQKNTDGSFSFPTNFGNIMIQVTPTPDNAVMTEIDTILASLKKE